MAAALSRQGANFWSQLSADDRSALVEAGVIRSFPRAAVLCGQGQPAGRVFVLQAGRVDVYRDDPTGHRTMLAIRGPGDLIGELSALDRTPVSGTVVVADPATALVVPASRFEAMCRVRSGIAWPLLQILVARLRESDVRRGQYRADVRRRTMLALLALVEPIAQASASRQPVTLRLTQQKLANQVASSLVSVTRVLEDLRNRNVITTGRGRITVYPEQLRALHLAESW